VNNGEGTKLPPGGAVAAVAAVNKI